MKHTYSYSGKGQRAAEQRGCEMSLAKRRVRGGRGIQKVCAHAALIVVLNLTVSAACVCTTVPFSARMHDFALRHRTALGKASCRSKEAFGSTQSECIRLLDALWVR